jgi:hypothetical protein
MLQIDTATVNARVKAVCHFLNILRADIATVAGVTLYAYAKPFRDFLCHFSGVLMLGFRVGVSFPTLPRISHRLRSD